MAPLDLATAINAAAAALALALRGNMLKPEAKAWASSRPASLVILGLSVFEAGLAINVWLHGHATPRDAGQATAVALYSWAMLIHLWMQRHPPQGRPQ